MSFPDNGHGGQANEHPHTPFAARKRMTLDASELAQSALSGARVRQIMHVGVEWASPDTPVVEIAQIMRKHDVGAVPIGERDRVVGMVTDRDLVCRGLAQGGDISALTARDVMTRGAVWCRLEETLSNAVHIMGAWKVRRLPVINRDRRMVGIIGLGDISTFAPEALSCEVLTAVSAHHGEPS